MKNSFLIFKVIVIWLFVALVVIVRLAFFVAVALLVAKLLGWV